MEATLILPAGKFIVVMDTLCSGWSTWLDDQNYPVMWDSYREAFMEMFNDAYEWHYDNQEYSTMSASDLVTMNSLNESKDYAQMVLFWESHPEANEHDEWIEPSETFQLGK